MVFFLVFFFFFVFGCRRCIGFAHPHLVLVFGITIKDYYWNIFFIFVLFCSSLPSFGLRSLLFFLFFSILLTYFPFLYFSNFIDTIIFLFLFLFLFFIFLFFLFFSICLTCFPFLYFSNFIGTIWYFYCDVYFYFHFLFFLW